MVQPLPTAGDSLVLFCLGGTRYACRRDAVLEVVDIGGGRSPIEGLPSAGLSILDGPDRHLKLLSLRLMLGLPDAGPFGRILVVRTRHGSFGYLVDDVIGVRLLGTGGWEVRPNRLSRGYSNGTVTLDGDSWRLIDWDAVPRPVAAGSA